MSMLELKALWNNTSDSFITLAGSETFGLKYAPFYPQMASLLRRSIKQHAPLELAVFPLKVYDTKGQQYKHDQKQRSVACRFQRINGKSEKYFHPV